MANIYQERDRAVIAGNGFRVETELCLGDSSVLYTALDERGERALFKCMTYPGTNGSRAYSAAGGDPVLSGKFAELQGAGSGEGGYFLLPLRDVRVVPGEDTRICLQMKHRETLASCFSAGKMKVSDLLGMAHDICCALNWCRQIVPFHNRLHAANIFGNDGNWLLGECLFRTELGNEDPFCIAPELFGQTLPSEKSDIYSLGMVMYFLVSGGIPPFGGAPDALERLRGGALPEQPEGCPDALFRIIRKALAPENERYSGTNLMLWDIELLQKEMTPEDGARCLLPAGTADTEKLKKPKKAKPPKPPKPPRPPKPPKAPKPEKVKPVKEEKSAPTPEELEQKRKNRRDGWIFGGIAVLTAALLSGVVLRMYLAMDEDVYSLISSESYAVAFREISERYGEGRNVDALLDAYVEACMDDLQYRRVNQALPMYSEEACADTAYFCEIVRTMFASHQDRLAAEAAEILAGRAALADAMNEILEENDN